MKDKILLNWYGTLAQGSGYAGASEKMALALDKRELDVRVVSFVTKSPQSNTTSEGLELRRKPFKMAKVGMCFGLPNSFTSIQNEVKIGYTMFETDKLPRTTGANNWSGETGQPEDNCNKMNMLLVPSKHNKELFEKEGVKVPIEVVPLGIDPNHYVKMVRPKRNTFTFLMYGVLTIRKNPGAALSAFLDLFKDRDDVRIIFKTHSGTMGAIQMPYKNVQIIDEYTTPEKMLTYLRDADCFVFPSRGEGFGLPPVEAMATGLPVILSNNTGMSEFCDGRYNYPIRCLTKSKVVRFPPKWGDVGNWYEPDYDDLKAIMKFVESHRESAYEKGLLAADWVHENWTFDKTVEKIENIVRSLV